MTQSMKNSNMLVKHLRSVGILVFLSLIGSSALAAENSWHPLFDGSSLDGWKQRGGAAKYRVENGEIIGTSVRNTGNSFLCTEQDYGDFILELEFKVHPQM